jgi:D-glycero-D-manno-heptose 1,7-bisphosphate phosphatase
MEYIPEGASSLEHETFPLLAARGELFGLPHDGFFLDMGLPESYAAAQKTVPAWLEKQKRWSTSCRMS